MQLTKIVYKIVGQLPKGESFGLVSQAQRAAVAIPSNIAEGKKRKTRKDFAHFLRIANGSAAELETQLLLIRDVYNEVTVSEALEMLEEVQKMLTTMINKLES